MTMKKKTIDSGKLNRRISFVHKKEVKNELGQISFEDAIYKTVWAKVSPLRGYEQSVDDRVAPRTVYSILTRYHKGISQDMKILFDGKQLEITQICDIDSGHYALEITAILKGELVCQQNSPSQD